MQEVDLYIIIKKEKERKKTESIIHGILWDTTGYTQRKGGNKANTPLM